MANRSSTGWRFYEVQWDAVMSDTILTEVYYFRILNDFRNIKMKIWLFNYISMFKFFSKQIL